MALKVKFRTQFPALVRANSPILLTKSGLSYTFGFDAAALQTLFNSIYQPTITFTQPVSYPSAITSGHAIPFCDSDTQFGNAYSQYPIGSVSSNPLIIGKSGSTIGSSTVGQTFKIVFTSTGLTGSPITKTYTAVGGDTVTTIATALAALVNADPVLHGLGGKPIFMQSLGAGVFNLQYDSALSATGATPLTTATTGSTGTINLTAEVNALDFIVMQLGRNVPGRPARPGDGIYGIDATGQDSTGTFNTHYGQWTVTATTTTAGGTRGTQIFSTAGNTGPIARFGFSTGAWLYDASGVLPSGGDLGPGTFNIPAVGKFSIDNVNNIRRNAGAAQFIVEATNTDNLIFSTSGGGVGINATPTGVTFSSGLGFFVFGTQVPTTGTGISLAGGTNPVLSSRNYGTATALPLILNASSITSNLGAIGYSTGAGGAITQATSRTTGVTLNTAAGAITLISAAGSATPTTFTFTNSAIAATDVVIWSQKSGTDKYEIFTTAVGAGSCSVTFFTTGGTTTEQPVFNFAVIKAAAN